MKKIIFTLGIAALIFGTSFAQDNSGSSENAPAQIMVEPFSHGSRDVDGCIYLVLMDNLPWGSTAITDILDGNGETYDVATSATFPAMDFLAYDVIIVAGDQNPAFHAVFSANFTKFVDFVLSGRTLQVNAATCGWNSPCDYSVLLPGGVYTVEQYDNYNDIADPASPVVAGLPNPFYGTYASHGYFENLQPGTEIITTAQSNGLPTCIQYNYGPGIVLAGTQPFSYGYAFGEASGDMLVNSLSYSCQHSIENTVPVSPWAIGLGIFLILVFTVYRVRKN